MLPEGLKVLFDVIVCGDEITRDKPAPDPYELALKRLKLEPWECLAVENSPVGIQSAKAAGLTCVALQTSLSLDSLKEADAVLGDLSQLVGYLKRELPRPSFSR